jgi:CxxC motif-containing protein (DUF1111 family)
MRLKSLFFIIALTLASAAYAGNHPYETSDLTRNAFGNPFPSISRDDRRAFFVGNSFFRQNWVEAPATTTARDGLGPTFNAVSCTACHQLNGRGEGAGEGFAHVSLLFRLDGAPDYGGQLNPFGITDVPGEAHPYISFNKISGQYADGEKYELREPVYKIVDWMFGEPPKNTRVSPRVANQLIGAGLLEKIPAQDIEGLADPNDKDNDGISGRAVYVLNLRTKAIELGRFGWKAEQPSLKQQNAAALNGDMGLTTTLFPQQNCTSAQTDCLKANSGGEPEVDDEILARVTTFTQNISIPMRRSTPDTNGEQTFKSIGCASCHHESYTVNEITISPFTDLLLHDMGPGLSDRSLGGDILPTEWRTPPLWGVGLIEIVNGHNHLLHDGRARGVAEAILWHDGEGRRSRDAFVQLSKTQRQELIQFVESL